MKALLFCIFLAFLSAAIGVSRAVSYTYEANINALRGDRPVLGGVIYRRCTASPTSLTWRYEWIFPNKTKTRGETVLIYNVRMQDLGTYTCIARSYDTRPPHVLVTHSLVGVDGGSGTSSNRGRTGDRRVTGGRGRGSGRQNTRVSGSQTTRRYQYLQLRINQQPGERLVYGGTIRRRCSIARPGFTIYWIYPNGRQVPGDLLSLDNIRQRDVGTYTCKAIGHGYTITSNFTLSFRTAGNTGSRGRHGGSRQEVGRLTIRPEAGENFQYGGTIRRRCLVNKPGYRVIWIYPNGRQVYSQYLSLDNLNLNDAGTYTCRATGNGLTTITASFQLRFERSDQSTSVGSGGSRQEVGRLTIRPEAGENIRYGGTVRRRCLVNKPGYRVIWIYPNGRQVSSQYLFLNNLNLNDAGTYTCRATGNGLTTITASFQLRFERSDQSTSVGSGVSVSRTRIRVDIRTEPGERLISGGTIRRRCVVNQPGFTIYWVYPNGRRVPGDLLYLDNIGSNTAGRYVCEATRNGWTTRATFDLTYQTSYNTANRGGRP